jgi:hypothetical protein
MFIVTVIVARADRKRPYASVETKVFKTQQEVDAYKLEVEREVKEEFELEGVDIWSDDFDYFMDYQREPYMDMELVEFRVREI